MKIVIEMELKDKPMDEWELYMLEEETSGRASELFGVGEEWSIAKTITVRVEGATPVEKP